MVKKIIIIADRKQSYIDSMQQVLKEYGIQVLVKYDGISGLNITRIGKPDLILIEAMLSGASGYQICSLIKFDIKYEDIVVVILSDGDGARYRQLADNSGADGILVKPVDLNELIGIVKSVNLKA